MQGQCVRCGRKLTNPVSVRRGIGPVCGGRVGTGGGNRNYGLSKLSLDESAVFVALDMRQHGLQLTRRQSGGIAYNVPHYCVHHSPTGFEWGFSGSGPADLALNAVEHLLHLMDYKGIRMTDLSEGSCFRAAWRLHHPFKDKFIIPMRPEGGQVPYQEMVAWIREHQGVLDECTLKPA